MRRLRQSSNFLRALEHLGDPYYRQTGSFAPVPQLLSSTHFDWRTEFQQDGKDSPHQRNSETMSGKAAKGHGHTRPRTAPGQTSWNSGGCARPVIVPKKTPKRVSSAGASRPPPRGTAAGNEHTQHDLDSDSPLFSRPSLRFVTRPSTSPASEKSLSPNWPVMSAMSSVASNHSDAGTMLKVLSTAQPGAERGSRRVAVQMAPSAENVHRSALLSPAHMAATPSAAKRDRPELLSSEVGDGLGPRHARFGGVDSLEGTAMEATPTAVVETRLEKMQQAGSGMTAKPRRAAWTSHSHSDNLPERAEAILNEQLALDEKEVFLNAMRREGPKSLTRQLVCTNIENRLKAAAGREAKAKSDVHSQCTCISDNLASMQNSRHELHKIRKYAHVFMGDHVKGTDASFANAVRRRYTRNPKSVRTTRLV